MNKTTGFAAIVAFTFAIVSFAGVVELGTFTFGAKSECEEKFDANTELRHNDDGAREPRRKTEDNIVNL
jgi:hypothetical protein